MNSIIVCMQIIFGFAILQAEGQQDQGNVEVLCGPRSNATYDVATESCMCPVGDYDNRDSDDDPNRINIAGIFDTTSFDWGEEVFEFTAYSINNQQEQQGSLSSGWLGTQNILKSGQFLDYSVADAACDETIAARAYWELRENNNRRPMHGIVGGRCSGASISMARIAGLEDVPQVSPWSTSERLSDKEKFPYFSRLVGPDSADGEVGGIVALLRGFGWERITILNTDTQYAKDLVPELKRHWVGEHRDPTGEWVGEIAYSDTIRLDEFNDGLVDADSVRHALGSIEDPTVRSRVVVLIGHNHHAYQILRTAKEYDFQPETIFVGVSSWIGRAPPPPNDDLSSWLPEYPGYIGLTYYFNRNSVYSSFLADMQQWQSSNGREVWVDLPSVIIEYMVDSITLLTRALASVEPFQRRDHGSLIASRVREQEFEGLTGRVKLTEEGDRFKAQFTISHLRPDSDGGYYWAEIGTTNTQPGSAIISLEEICWAVTGCGVDSVPADSYPPPKNRAPVWVPVIVVLLLILFLVVAVKYWRSRKSKHSIREELEAFRDSVVGMRAVEMDYVPASNSSSALDLRGSSSGKHGRRKIKIHPSSVRVRWCWQETPGVMNRHDIGDIVGDPSECWIKYDANSNSKLESAYEEQGRGGSFSPMDGYVVDFDDMIQVKSATGFKRKVRRIVESFADGNVPKEVSLDIDKINTLPKELEGEPKMVLVKNDIVQISKQRSDGWAFGTKLYHADEAMARELVKVALGSVQKDEEIDVFADTGWFELEATRVPTADDLQNLQNNVGDVGALEPPDYWDPVVDPSVVQKHRLSPADPEYDTVVRAFKSTLVPPRFDKKVKILKVERIQNLAMYQSYVVKRQTICYREAGIQNGDDSGTADADEMKKKALDRFERRWLWHGTNEEVMDKILQQGFNRSFCGKNATMYGKGVYFARDSEYSAYPTYAVKNKKGEQYIMACRVVVGEYCVGQQDALTPSVRDAKSQSLYDSTVGLLLNDTMADPSIYVTYHDAQSYPDYLIKFRAT